MKIVARVKPSSKVCSIEKRGNYEYILSLKAPPIEGRANTEVIDLLSGYFKISKSRIKILRGQKSRIKIVSIT